jgi:hypothetical protein
MMRCNREIVREYYEYVGELKWKVSKILRFIITHILLRGTAFLWVAIVQPLKVQYFWQRNILKSFSSIDPDKIIFDMKRAFKYAADCSSTIGVNSNLKGYSFRSCTFQKWQW